jgi:hypothetical protein
MRFQTAMLQQEFHSVNFVLFVQLNYINFKTMPTMQAIVCWGHDQA